MKNIVFRVLFLWLIALPVFAAEVDFPPLSGQVVDEAGVLTPEEKSRIKQILSTDKDNQVAVVILKDLRGQNGREYGVELARRWQLGQKGKDNGVLILFSVKDRYAGIEVGYGLEGTLPDSLAGRILREAVFPPLKRNLDYGEAALNGAYAVMTVLNGGKLKDGMADAEEPFGDALSTLIALIVVYLVLTGRMHPGLARGGFFRRGGSGGGFWGGGGGFGGGGAGGRF
ncbi:MAG: TPM domain-containing protein [Proteobacteria bacterium]|nr:TPM domain-containing protein [Pseudomonadota bacterium]